MKDVISVHVSASPEDVYEALTSMEKIRVWEPSHGLFFVTHEWSPSEGRLKVGNILKVKSVVWTFVARCTELKEFEVKWEFIEGPLKGTESWMAKAENDGCEVIKLLEYEVPKLRDKLLWHVFGRKIHNLASKRQLQTIKELVEG
jgi:hypothetical protein